MNSTHKQYEFQGQLFGLAPLAYSYTSIPLHKLARIGQSAFPSHMLAML